MADHPDVRGPRSYSTQGRRLKEDANARMWRDRGGFLLSGACFSWRTAFNLISGGRTWWAFGDAFWETAGYQSKDVLALLRDRERRQERELDRAHMLLGAAASREHKRERPNTAMRRTVFERDGDGCVECGSTFYISTTTSSRSRWAAPTTSRTCRSSAVSATVQRAPRSKDDRQPPR